MLLTISPVSEESCSCQTRVLCEAMNVVLDPLEGITRQFLPTNKRYNVS